MTEEQKELLYILAEEASEITIEAGQVSQRCMKMLRFGPEDVQEGFLDDNVKRLSEEIGDLYEMVRRATGLGLVEEKYIASGMERKRQNLKKYSNLGD